MAAESAHLDPGGSQPHAGYAQAARRRRTIGLGKGFLAYSVLTLFAVIAIGPFLYLLSPSLRHSYDLFTFPPQWLPKSLYLGNFGAVLHQTSYVRWGLNTFIFATSVTLITLAIDTLAGYAFARLHFPGR